jgi:hypothetical protein
MLYDIRIGTVYDVKFYAPAILGNGLSKAKAVAILDYQSAMPLQDVSALHAQVYALLPTGTPTDPAKLYYIKFITSTGNIQVVAYDWVSIQPTIAETSSTTLTVFNTTSADIPKISAIMKSNGYPSFAFN